MVERAGGVTLSTRLLLLDVLSPVSTIFQTKCLFMSFLFLARTLVPTFQNDLIFLNISISRSQLLKPITYFFITEINVKKMFQKDAFFYI